MILQVRRERFEPTFTLGRLFIDGEDPGIFTLEDAVRDSKIQDRTAIPAGTYDVVIDFSQRFQRDLPRLLNVPGFEGIRIHTGNTTADTSGCILVGKTWSGRDLIGQSRKAFNELLLRMVSAKSIIITVA